MHLHSHSAACDCSPAAVPGKLRALWTALVLVGSFSAIELWVSWQSHSLSLLADAGHMLADVVAIGLSLFAVWVSQWPATEQAPFGYRRVEILAALANGLLLLAVGLWVGWEALMQVQSPPTDILSGPMAITAAVGLIVNGFNAFLIHRHAEQDLNLRGAFLHMLADAVSCLGVAVAAIAIWQFQWYWADGVIGLGVAGLILSGAVPLIRQSLEILLERAPRQLSSEQIRDRLRATGGVVDVSQLRLWTIAPGQVALTVALAVTAQGLQRDGLLLSIQSMLRQDFGITDTVIQMMTATVMPVPGSAEPKIQELIPPASSSTV
ncbi:cation transporter [Romeria aff. gracilis LEGE 07310]|uniref:Cation transporter n=1 Tax=Vasconcelosia minhoensis LEGE 07310 TaxID=915328 RepID=A0A8J7DL97_9CYAN|nr:cation diffusion facilitator family transporter [Romeria gracilis]MBE9077091.1 cation transporter [Romeria aff. gracilis LEGE 07310]